MYQIDPSLVAVLLALVVQTGAAMYWAGGVSSNLKHLDKKVGELSKQVARHGD